jgi:hypothetical protein
MTEFETKASRFLHHGGENEYRRLLLTTRNNYNTSNPSFGIHFSIDNEK